MKYLYYFSIPLLFFLIAIQSATEPHNLYSPGWHDITEHRIPEFTSQNSIEAETLSTKTENVFLYTKHHISEQQALNKISGKKSTVLFVIHGTWGTDDPQFKDPKHTTFKTIMKYAATMGNLVELVCVSWSGKNAHDDRKRTAAYIFNNMLRHFYFNPTTALQILLK